MKRDNKFNRKYMRERNSLDSIQGESLSEKIPLTESSSSSKVIIYMEHGD